MSIKMKHCLACLLYLYITLILCVEGSARKVTATTRPHIVLIVADDLGYNDVSFHGSDQIPTPNIDFLGYSGIILNNYYVSPICTPTRSALMTGRHPIHTGMQHSVIFGSEPYGLPLNETIMPQYFNKLGYRSHIVGKWHLGMHKWDYTPLYRGFESHLGYYQGCEDYYTHTYEADLDQWGVDFRRDNQILWNYTGQYSTEIFKQEAISVINRHNKSEPLFLYLPFQAVHSGNGDGPNLQAPVEYINRFSYIENEQRRIYAAMVSALDDAVGAVYDTLKENGMLENSIIVFTTDNGGPANGFDYNAANNFPLRGVKSTLWEGGVRGVGFIHSPLLETQGYVSEQMLHVCDWLPTLYRAAGGDPATMTNLDGFDSWDMLSKNGEAVREEMLHNIDPRQDSAAAIRVGDFKLLVGGISMEWGGWYPPYQLHGDEEILHYSNLIDHMTVAVEKGELREQLQRQYRKLWTAEVNSRMKELYLLSEQSGFYRGENTDFQDVESQLEASHTMNTEGSDLRLMFRSEKFGEKMVSDMGRASKIRLHRGTPVTVNCGGKPANASTNCNPHIAPCLYHIPSDPCEYNNIADSHTVVVAQLLRRLTDYANTMVPPGNLPVDERGNPKYHGGAWVPWL